MSHHHDFKSKGLSAERGGFSESIDPSFHHSTIPEDSNEFALILYDDGTWSEGHYQSIFCLYLKALLQNGLKVSAACPQPDTVSNWLTVHCPQQSGNCMLHLTAGRPLKQKFRRLKPFTRLVWWARAARAVRRIHRLDSHHAPVFFMNINHLRGALWSDRFAGWIFPFQWGAFSYDSAGRSATIPALQKQFSFLNARQCKAFGVTDEKVIAPMQKAFPKLRIVFLPDTTPEECTDGLPLAEKILRRASGRKIVGLLGMLHKRKGLLTALQLAKARPDLFFLFAGAYDLNKLSPDEKTLVQFFFDQPPENCFCHLLRIADEADFNALVKLTHVVLAVYPGFTNSSGLLTKAGIFGKPCLVAEGDTCMADRVRKYNLGLCAPREDIPSCSAAIDKLLENAERNNQSFCTDFNEEALHAALNKLTGVFYK